MVVPTVVSPTVERYWEANERVLRRIVKGMRFDQQSYESAVAFFEETTGIPASDHGTFFGRLPSSTLAKDVKTWRVWYEEKKSFLYLDPTSSRILPLRKIYDMKAEIVSIDMKTHTLTIKDEKGATKTVPVLEQARESMANFKAGDRVTLTCEDSHAIVIARDQPSEGVPDQRK